MYNEVGAIDATTRWDIPLFFGASFNIGEAKLVDERVLMKKDRSFKVTIHSNGVGPRLPIGWIIED
nr:hypothetical protein [uncultured Draconibacterium sp.]